MDATTSKISIAQIKQTAKANLRVLHAFPKSINHIGIVAIKDPVKRRFVLEGIAAIGMAAVVLSPEEKTIENIVSADKVNQNDLVGFDFFVYDNEHDNVDVVKYMQAGVVPIMPEKNVFSGMLKDFNPMKFEGNGFFYKSENPYCVFEKIVAYTENIKFPEDRRVLLKNVIGTF